MSIEGRHAYRFGYLASEEWSDTRIEALVKFDATCFICRERDTSNDAHHVFYRGSFWNTEPDDLVILCRQCHELLHRILSIRKADSGDEKDCFREFKQLVDSIRQWRLHVEPRPEVFFKRNSKRLSISKLEGFSRLKKLKTPNPPVTTGASKGWKHRCISCHRSDCKLTEHELPVTKYYDNSGIHPWCSECWKEFSARHIKNWADIRAFWSWRRLIYNSKREEDERMRSWFPII